jgi:CRP-like cAMP-binding protein
VFFKKRNYDDRTMLDIIGTSSHEEFKKGTILFKAGSIGDKFYLILHGKVSVNIPRKSYKELKRHLQKVKTMGNYCMDTLINC